MTERDAPATLDAIDRELLSLLNRRAEITVAQSRTVGQPSNIDPAADVQLLGALQKASEGPLKPSAVSSIWREILSACRALAMSTRVAYLGPKGTFSEQAALQFFGSQMAHVPCVSFDEVFHAAASGAAEFGVVPVENSTEGVVTRALDLLLGSPLHIVGELSLLVRHHLLRTSASLEGIEAVLAHPQALAQCQGWLGKHLPNAERRAVSSNAEGARLAAAHPEWAGIAGDRAAAEFGLQYAAQAIQDDSFNRTRFAIVCLPQVLQAPAASGRDCVSLVVSVPNRPGAVHDLLVPLKQHGVSMTRFESRPARSGQWEYYFYIDIEGHPSQPNVSAALADLRSLCAFYKVLGTYPVTE